MRTAITVHTRSRGKQWSAVVALAATAAAFSLRVWRLGSQELRGDEAFTYFFSLRSPAEILNDTLTLAEPHPVAYYFLQHAWLQWVGHSEFALRFLGVWFGVLAVAATYRLGRHIELPAGAAVIGAGILAISPFAIGISQDARMYSMVVLLSLLSICLTVEILRREGWETSKKSIWLLYVVISWLALHTHYYAALIILAQNVIVLGMAACRPPKRWVILPWVISQLALFLLFLPWLLAAGDKIIEYPGAVESPGFLQVVIRTLSALFAGETLAPTWRVISAAVGALLVLLGVRFLIKRRKSRDLSLLFLLGYLVIPILITWLNALRGPFFQERYLSVVLPAFCLLMGVGILAPLRVLRIATEGRPSIASAITRLFVPLLIILITGSVLTVSMYNLYLHPAYSKTHGWRELAGALERLTIGYAPDQISVAENFPDPTLWYYAGAMPHVMLPPAAQDMEGALRLVNQLHAAGTLRVLLPVQPSPIWDDAGIAQTSLQRRYTLLGEQRVGVWSLQVYERPPDAMEKLDMAFANGIVLSEAAVRPPLVVPEGFLAVHLHVKWEPGAGHPERLSGREKLFLHLLDEQAEIVAQRDVFLTGSHLQQGALTFGVALEVQESAQASTRYRLILGIYDPGKEGMPRVPTVHGGDHVQVAELAAWTWPH